MIAVSWTLPEVVVYWCSAYPELCQGGAEWRPVSRAE